MSSSAAIVAANSAALAAVAARKRKEKALKQCARYDIEDYETCRDKLKQLDQERMTAECAEVGIYDPHECFKHHNPHADAIAIVGLVCIGVAMVVCSVMAVKGMIESIKERARRK